MINDTNKEFDIRRMVGDGGMPSCHSATVTAVAIATGYECGFHSPLFALSGILAIIVMHDAMGVRMETGTHAKLLNEMITFFEALGQKQVSVETKLKEFVGHTPTQTPQPIQSSGETCILNSKPFNCIAGLVA